MNTPCTTIQSRLSRYIDRQLPEEESRDVERHLTLCRGCRVESEILVDAKKILMSKERIPDFLTVPLKLKRG